MLITVQRSSWGLASCVLSRAGVDDRDESRELLLHHEGFDIGELDACLRQEWAGYVVDEESVFIWAEWLRGQHHGELIPQPTPSQGMTEAATPGGMVVRSTSSLLGRSR